MFAVRTHRGRGVLRGAAPRAPGPPLRATARELVMLLAVASAATLVGWGILLAAEDLVTRDPVPMPVPAAETRTLALPMLINIAVDDSGSMSDSDPDDRRWTDAAALGRWLARHQREDDLVAVTRFAGDAVHGPVVSSRRLTNDPRQLAPSPSSDGTAFMPVVDGAAEIFAEQEQACYRILILLTDGAADDAPEAIAKLPTVANRVFVVALDRGDAWDSARTAWERAGFPVTKLGNRAPNEIGAALARAVMAATGEEERPR